MEFHKVTESCIIPIEIHKFLIIYDKFPQTFQRCIVQTRLYINLSFLIVFTHPFIRGTFFIIYVSMYVILQVQFSLINDIHEYTPERKIRDSSD